MYSVISETYNDDSLMSYMCKFAGLLTETLSTYVYGIVAIK